MRENASILAARESAPSRWVTVLGLATVVVAGCSNAKQSGVSGAGVGALSDSSTVDQAINSANANRPFATGSALARLVGNWTIRGFVDDGQGQISPVNGAARITAERNYFVRIELRFADARSNQIVEGTSVVSQVAGRALEMTNSLSSLPQPRRYAGEVDLEGTTFTFAQVDPPATSRKIILHVPGTGGFAAEGWDGSKQLETYTFSPASRTALAR